MNEKCMSFVMVLGFSLGSDDEEVIRKKNKTIMNRAKGAALLLQQLDTQYTKVILSGKGLFKISESEFLEKEIQRHSSKDFVYLQENNSKNTLENLIFVWPLIFRKHFGITSMEELLSRKDLTFDIKIVTSFFHLRRSVFLMKMIYEEIKLMLPQLFVPSLEDVQYIDILLN